MREKESLECGRMHNIFEHQKRFWGPSAGPRPLVTYACFAHMVTPSSRAGSATGKCYFSVLFVLFKLSDAECTGTLHQRG